MGEPFGQRKKKRKEYFRISHPNNRRPLTLLHVEIKEHDVAHALLLLLRMMMMMVFPLDDAIVAAAALDTVVVVPKRDWGGHPHYSCAAAAAPIIVKFLHQLLVGHAVGSDHVRQTSRMMATVGEARMHAELVNHAVHHPIEHDLVPFLGFFVFLLQNLFR